MYFLARVLPVVLVVLCWNAVSGRSLRTQDGDDWNLFVFTQFWPQTQCFFNRSANHDGLLVLDNGMNKNCVPAGITKWTIHGLWPTVGTEHKPVYCNDSWPFNKSAIEDLKPKLELQWPSFESDATEFWKHEWEKHGTCCTNLPYLNSEHKYFAVILSLNIKFDIFSVLGQKGIVPSDDQMYQVKDIEQALFDMYQTRSTVYCMTPKHSEQMLSYVELCLDKTLKPIDCIDTTAHCDHDKPVSYPPIIPL